MFDIYTDIWYNSVYANSGYALYVASRPRRLARTSHPRRQGGNVAGRSGPYVWRFPAVGQRLGSMPTRQRAYGFARPTTRPATYPAPQTLPSGDGSSADYRPLPRPTQAAFYALDTRSSPRFDSTTFWHSALYLDCGSLSGPLGLYPAEAGTACLRTRSCCGAPLVETRVSRHPRFGSSGESNYLLGRRDRDAFGSPSRHLLRQARTYTGYPRHGQTFPLQYDFGDYQPGRIGLQGFQRAVYSAIVSQLPGAPYPAASAQSLFDYRPAPCPSFAGCYTLDKAYPENPNLPSSGIQPSAQPGRIAQSRCQSQRRWAATPADTAGAGKQRPKISLERSASAAESTKLLPRAARALRCLRCQTFLLPVISDQQPL